MSLSSSQAIEASSLGLLMLVAPELGETYAGKTLATASAITMMVGLDIDRQMAVAPAIRTKLKNLLATATISDSVLAQDIQHVLNQPDGDSWQARQNSLLALLERVHAFADINDKDLANKCLDFLVEMATSEMPAIPEIPS